MPAAQHYSFAAARLEPVVAHDGRGSIAAARVLTQDRPGVAFVDLVVVPPGAGIGTHTHDTGDEEVYVVISGQGTMLVDGQPLAVGAGDVVVNRRGGTHGLDNAGAEPLHLVVVDVALPAEA